MPSKLYLVNHNSKWRGWLLLFINWSEKRSAVGAAHLKKMWLNKNEQQFLFYILMICSEIYYAIVFLGALLSEFTNLEHAGVWLCCWTEIKVVQSSYCCCCDVAHFKLPLLLFCWILTKNNWRARFVWSWKYSRACICSLEVVRLCGSGGFIRKTFLEHRPIGVLLQVALWAVCVCATFILNLNWFYFILNEWVRSPQSNT